jgi:hypothetical protein
LLFFDRRKTHCADLLFYHQEDIPQFIIQTAFLAWSTDKNGWGSSDVFTLFSSIVSFTMGLLLCGKAMYGLTNEPKWAKKG